METGKMAIETLTNKLIETRKLKPNEKESIIFDTLVPSFYLRIGKRDKVYNVYVTLEGKRQRCKIGNAKHIALADARDIAREYVMKASKGIDPRIEKIVEKAETEKVYSNTFETLVAKYKDHMEAEGKRTLDQDLNRIECNLKIWKNLPVSSIKKTDLVKVLDEIKNRGALNEMDKVRGLVSNMFDYAIEWGMTEINPASGIKKSTKYKQKDRKRDFTDDEIRDIWKAGDWFGGVKGATIKLLILTGQRASVISGLKRDEVNLDEKLILIPAGTKGRSKNDLDHIVPLSDQALEIIKGIPDMKSFEHLLSSTVDTPINLSDKFKKEVIKVSGVDDWIWNNFRGLVTTRMRKPLGIGPWLIDHVQGRLDQSVQRRHYDANDYLDEKRNALQVWANYIDTVLAGEEYDGDNVISIYGGK